MEETPINIAYPAAEALHLRIALGACRFKAKPGEGDAWVAGTYHDPTNRMSLRILEERESVTITEAEPSLERIPAVFGGVPRYELGLGKQRPFALTIETGASEFDLDLGACLFVALRSGKVRASSNSASRSRTPSRWNCWRSQAGRLA